MKEEKEGETFARGTEKESRRKKDFRMLSTGQVERCNYCFGEEWAVLYRNPEKDEVAGEPLGCRAEISGYSKDQEGRPLSGPKMEGGGGG